MWLTFNGDECIAVVLGAFAARSATLQFRLLAARSGVDGRGSLSDHELLRCHFSSVLADVVHAKLLNKIGCYYKSILLRGMLMGYHCCLLSPAS